MTRRSAPWAGSPPCFPRHLFGNHAVHGRGLPASQVFNPDRCLYNLHVDEQTKAACQDREQPEDGKIRRNSSLVELHNHINVFHSDEDEGYVADIPDLVACSAFGSTPEEALREVEAAKSAWIEAARAEGKPVPPPKYRPLIYQYSS